MDKSKHMEVNRFYMEEEGIIFESYTEEPGCEHISWKITGSHDAMPDEDDAASGRYGSSMLPERSREFLILHDEPGFLPGGAPSLVTVDIGKLRRAGVPEYVIGMIVENSEELSTLKITRSGRILLPEYKIEIRMTPLDKALYFLYLRHPEGIRFKDLCDHRDELVDIYSSVSGRSEPELIRESIDALVDPLNNSVNEKCSRIKRAFTRAFSPELARNYYIDGKSGEPKSIALDRDLVIRDEFQAVADVHLPRHLD